jgi:hypothetical protein
MIGKDMMELDISEMTPIPVKIISDPDKTTHDETLDIIPLDLLAFVLLPSGNYQFVGPPPGWYYDVNMIIANGYTAGTVSVYKNDPNNPAEIRGVFTTTGILSYGKCNLVLSHNDNILLVPSGLSGTPSFAMTVIKVKREYFRKYIT